MFFSKFTNLFVFLLFYDLHTCQVNIAHVTKDAKTFCVCHLHKSKICLCSRLFAISCTSARRSRKYDTRNWRHQDFVQLFVVSLKF